MPKERSGLCPQLLLRFDLRAPRMSCLRGVVFICPGTLVTRQSNYVISVRLPGICRSLEEMETKRINPDFGRAGDKRTATWAAHDRAAIRIVDTQAQASFPGGKSSAHIFTHRCPEELALPTSPHGEDSWKLGIWTPRGLCPVRLFPWLILICSLSLL